MSLDELLVRLDARNIKYITAYSYEQKSGTTHKGALCLFFSCHKIKYPVDTDGNEVIDLLVPVELIKQIHKGTYRYKNFRVNITQDTNHIKTQWLKIDGFYDVKDEGLSWRTVIHILLHPDNYITKARFTEIKHRIRDRIVYHQQQAQVLLNNYDNVCTVEFMGGIL